LPLGRSIRELERNDRECCIGRVPYGGIAAGNYRTVDDGVAARTVEQGCCYLIYLGFEGLLIAAHGHEQSERDDEWNLPAHRSLLVR
jgi:hypothetical protein